MTAGLLCGRRPRLHAALLAGKRPERRRLRQQPQRSKKPKMAAQTDHSKDQLNERARRSATSPVGVEQEACHAIRAINGPKRVPPPLIRGASGQARVRRLRIVLSPAARV